MKSILISGGAGFIGSALALRLASRGHRVTVLDNLSAQIHGDNPAIPSGTGFVFVRGDVRSSADWLRALGGNQVVVHLAAETGTGQSMYQVEHYMDVNVRGTATLLDVLANQRHHVEKLIIASSRAIYGEGKYHCSEHGTVYPGARNADDLMKGDFSVKCPTCRRQATALATDEDSKLHPSSVYGISKQTQERLVMTVGPSLGIPAVALRYQNVYGPGQSLRNPYTGILAVFSTRIRNALPISIFEDGTESRDFIYIDDVVEATRLAIENAAADSETFNVGSGVKTDVLTVARTLQSALGGSSAIEVNGKFRVGDIRVNVADISRIRARLGFMPRVAFENGIRRFADWVNTQSIPVDRFEQSIEEMHRRGLYK
jgi:dTDP-L-rhamnose 4-epimerase